MTILDFNVMDSNVVDHSIDHDIYNTRPRRQVKEVTKEELKERDVPQIQIQIVDV